MVLEMADGRLVELEPKGDSALDFGQVNRCSDKAQSVACMFVATAAYDRILAGFNRFSRRANP